MNSTWEGTGGQVEFVRAGGRSIGGHSIIALPATAKGGTVSRITVHLSGPVTTARSDVDIVITEFSAAELICRKATPVVEGSVALNSSKTLQSEARSQLGLARAPWAGRA